jgi:glycosyltransferase involved in cell wall biosynthesis
MGGNPDIINEDTKCGLLVEYNDPSGLADAILRLSDDPDLQAELRSNAAKAVREKFNVDIMARKTYNLYVNALK